MSKNEDTYTNLLTCNLCLDDYNLNIGNVPRQLPCTHTLCDRCIRLLIDDNKLLCFECGKQHDANNGERSFPQNKYVLSLIRSKENDARDELPGLEKCEQHGKGLVLFCLEKMCQKLICVSCLCQDHKKHKVREIEDHVKEEIITKVFKLMQNIHNQEEIILHDKKNVADKFDMRRSLKEC